jgi:hypothetical protein
MLSLPFNKSKLKRINKYNKGFSILHFNVYLSGKAGHLSLVKLLYKLGKNIYPDVLFKFIEHNHLNAIKWFCSIKPELISVSAFYYADLYNNRSIIPLLHTYYIANNNIIDNIYQIAEIADIVKNYS